MKRDGTQPRRTPDWRPMIPVEVIRSRLGVDALGVYCALSLYADRKTGACWPKMETLSGDLEISRERVGNAIWKLFDAGLIEIQIDPDNRRHYLYVLPFQAKNMSQNGTYSAQHAPNRDTSMSQSGTQACPKSRHQLKDQGTDDHRIESPTTSAGAAPYQIFRIFCEETGVDESQFTEREKRKALGIAKTLVDEHWPADVVRDCIRYVMSEEEIWRSSPWDLATVLSLIGQWDRMGRPERAEPRKQIGHGDAPESELDPEKYLHGRHLEQKGYTA